MKYCNTCLYPETKPDLWFDENGKCSACLAFEARKNKDWKKWESNFHELMEKGKKHPVYDCIVPVSGGKDSHYQVIKLLELGYNPLCVNARTDDLTPIGRRNLDNIVNLGVDLIEVNVNTQIRRKIAKYALETVGDISWCEHVLIFTVPFNVACQLGIPTIIYGENPQNEYGAGPRGTESVVELGYDWLQEFGGLNGLRVDDIIRAGLATKNQMYQYIMPDGYHFDLVEPKAYFLGQFFPWDGKKNSEIASKYGFKVPTIIVGATGTNYENLDNHQTGIHDYFKYIKFGFGRATDIINNHIRRGRCSREYAKNYIYTYDDQGLNEYLGKNINDILSDIQIDQLGFFKIVNKFTNKELFDIDNYSYPRAKFLDDLKNA